ncbi:MAG: glycosyltransferase family 2 protein, partial [Cytophagaceae bacterium]
MIIIDIISIIIFSYCAFYIAYYIFFTIAGRLVKPREINDYKMAPGSIAVLIPAYKEDSVIVDTVEKNLSQNYPGENWKIIVIADSLKAETVQRLQKLPIITVVVDFEISRKAKAINAALLQIPNFDYIVILDADNVMGSDFLYKVNERLSAGAVAIQGHRTAKNNENSMAVLDGISEEINNHIFRYGQTVVGLSSALIGSGMAFQFEYYKSINSGVDDIW